MNQFTDEQIAALETIFGLKRQGDVVDVRDGVVTKDMMVWWRGDTELSHIRAGDDWGNIQRFPCAYQINKPKVIKIQYSE